MSGEDSGEALERSKRDLGRVLALGQLGTAIYFWRIGHVIIAAAMIYCFHVGEQFWAEVAAYALATWGLACMSRAVRKAAACEERLGDGDAGELSPFIIAAAMGGLWYWLH